MVTTNAEYKEKLEIERLKRGKRCHFCGIHVYYGEFSHIIHYKQQKVKGTGRGRNRRIIDIINHPHRYRLLCHDCHVEYDVQFRLK